MAQLVYTITGNNTGLATAVNSSIALIGKLQTAVDKLNATSFGGLITSLQVVSTAMSSATQTNQAFSTSLRDGQQAAAAFQTGLSGIAGAVASAAAAVQGLNTNVNTLNQSLSVQNAGGRGAGGGGLVAGFNANYIALLALATVGKKVISSNAEISDSLADVRRTASLTAIEAENLFNQLEKIDTRTSLKGLIDISTIGGQLGIAKEQLAGFTRATNELNVALKNEVTGGPEKIAKGLGILNNVFKISEKEGGDVEKAFNQIGSTILGLGQSGLATGDFLVTFGEKVGGIAAQAKLSLPVLLSYGATLQEQGVTAEVAGTAFKKLLSGLGTRPAKFFAVAQIADSTLTLKKFTDLINTDTNAALNLFFEGLKKGGPTTTSFLSLLKSVGLDAARSGQAISAISLNLDSLHTHFEQSNIDFVEASKAAAQAALEEDTLAGSIKRLEKAFVEATTSGAISNFFKVITDGIAGNIKALDKFFGSLHRLFTNSNGLGVLANLSATGLGENSLEKVDDIQNSFVSAEDIKNAFLAKNPITGNGEFPTLKGQSAETLKKQLSEIQIAYQSAYHAYSQYFNGVKAGTFNDSNVGIFGGLSRTEETARDILNIYNKIKEAYNALPVPKPGPPVTLPGKTKNPGTSGISQDEFLNRLQSFSDAAGAGADQSGLQGLDLTLQKIEDKYKKHFDTLEALRIQLDKSNKITDKQRVSDETAITDEERQLLIGKAKELSDARIKEAQRVSNEIQRINDEFGVRAEQSRGREIASIQRRYDAELVRAHGNADIIKALDAARSSALQAINDKYLLLEQELQASINLIDAQSQATIAGREESQTEKIEREWELRRKAANKYYEQLIKISATNPNNPTDILPGLTNAFNSLNLKRQQSGTNSGITAASTTEVNNFLNKDFTDGLKAATTGFLNDFVTGLENANQQIGYNFSTVFAGITKSFADTINGTVLTVISKQLEKKLQEGIDKGIKGLGPKLNSIIAGLAVAGGLISGLTSKTSKVGQGLGGALSGAASGFAIGSLFGGPLVGGVIGGVIGALGGIFGASKAQKELQAQQLAEAKQQTDLLRQSLAYTSSVIGRMTTQGIVTGVDVNAFGQLVAKVSGKDLQFVLDRV